MKARQEDLTGDIADFPLEVVQWMCEQQIMQGNPFNPRVFQASRSAQSSVGGFSWTKSSFGYDNCRSIIRLKKFNMFDILIEDNPYPKLMLVSNINDISTANIRCIIAYKHPVYIGWDSEVEHISICIKTAAWSHGWGLEDRFEYTLLPSIAMGVIQLFNHNIEFRNKLANLWGASIALRAEIKVSASLYAQIISFSTEESKETIKRIFKA